MRVHTPPLDRVMHHFGTDRPSVQRYEQLAAGAKEAASLLGECKMRWSGNYVVLYSGDRPTHLGVFGFSGD
ncbi:hypothetical protein [Streptomyces sp. NPDC048350]|uniref:hypothetical protein n=1 Tax=Streptomyces sp. NPDC048350 TaxID=3365538 RepID=UPI003715D1BB